MMFIATDIIYASNAYDLRLKFRRLKSNEQLRAIGYRGAKRINLFQLTGIKMPLEDK